MAESADAKYCDEIAGLCTAMAQGMKVVTPAHISGAITYSA
jgi:hypothetical protein